jgi:uncharacterized cupredoxin-like copper-binding protein
VTRARAFVAAALLVAAAGHLPAAAAAGISVRIKAGELYFEPKSVTAPAGPLTFEVSNEGAIEHNFVLEQPAKGVIAQVPVIAPGATERVTASVAPGTYRIVCSLPGHAEAGMVAELTVR